MPFYTSSVHLTVKLHLTQSPKNNKYYIKSQEDLYQVNEIFKLMGPGYSAIWWLYQIIATAFCILGALILAPVTWLEQLYADRNKEKAS